MRKLLFLTLALAGVSLSSIAQERARGVLVLQFAKVRGPQGVVTTSYGQLVPWTAERIYPKRAGVSRPPGSGEVGIQDLEAYRNDNGDASYVYTPENSSSLDDLKLNAVGNGKLWKQLTVGVNVDDAHRALIRWVIFNKFVQGRGSGVSAFDVVLGDFGGYWTPPDIGAWKVTFDVSVYPMKTPDGTAFFAQQFRVPQIPEQGEGAFDPAFANVFSGGGAQVGTSEDQFWYDASEGGPDGIYDEMEVDNYGGPPYEANLLVGITVGGTLREVVPSSYSVFRGSALSGSLSDLWYSDDSYLKVRNGPIALPSESPISVVVESQSPSGTILSLNFINEAKVSINNLLQKIEMFNFKTGVYDLVDTRAATTSDSSTTVYRTSSPGDYVETGTRKLRSRVSFKPGAPLFTNNYNASIDQTVWNVGTP